MVWRLGVLEASGFGGLRRLPNVKDIFLGDLVCSVGEVLPERRVDDWFGFWLLLGAIGMKHSLCHPIASRLAANSNEKGQHASEDRGNAV